MHMPCLMDGETLARRFRSYANKIEYEARKIHRKPSKHSVHDLRVAIRRTRSILWISRRGPKSRGLEKLNRQLRKLNRRLGRVRELEVAITDARTFRIKSGNLKKRRDQLSEKIAPLLAQKDRDRIQRKIKKATQNIRRTDRGLITESFAELHKQLAKWRKATLRRKSEIHRFRIFIKRLRYVSEVMGQNAKPLVNLQNALGAFHDLEVLEKLAGPNREVRAEMNKQRSHLNHLIPRTRVHPAK